MDLLFPKMRYDHTMPLLDGRIKVPGVTLKPVATPAMVWEDQPELRTGAFGLCDLHGGYRLSAIEDDPGLGAELLHRPGSRAGGGLVGGDDDTAQARDGV